MAKRSCGGFDYCILNKYYLCPYNYLRCTYIYKTTSAQKMTSISISNHTKPFRECHMREKGVITNIRQHRELCKKRAHFCRLRSEHIALYFKGHPLQNKNPAQEAYLAIKDHILHFETGQSMFLPNICNHFIWEKQFHRPVLTWDYLSSDPEMKQDYCCYANSKLYLVGKEVVLVSCLQRIQSVIFVKMKITRMNVRKYCVSKDWNEQRSSRWAGCPGVSSAMGPLANSPFPPWEAPESFILSLFCSSFSPWFPGSVGEHPWM